MVTRNAQILLLPFWHKNWRRMGHAQQDDSKMVRRRYRCFSPMSRPDSRSMHRNTRHRRAT
jgi:hypothetical protein